MPKESEQCEFICCYFVNLCRTFVSIGSFVVLRIRDGCKTIKEWYGVSIAGEITLSDVFADFASGTLDGKKELHLEYQTVFANVSVGKSTKYNCTTH